MKIPNKLNKKMVEFLTSLPNVHDTLGQLAFISNAGFDESLQKQILFPGSSAQFFKLLIHTLIDYGYLEDGRDPLEALLWAAKELVGQDKQQTCKALIAEWKTVRSHASPHLSGEPAIKQPRKQHTLRKSAENTHTHVRNLIPHFIQKAYIERTFEGHFDAVTIFVDVSGFTPMTQALMEHSHEGAEILASILNKLFDMMVEAVYERGGFVSLFAGDAFTAIFPFENPALPDDLLALHVLACVNKIQTIFRQHGIQTTPYGQFALHLKIGASSGMVEWGIVGHDEKTYFFRGPAIDGCAASEHHADKGDFIFDAQVEQLLRQIPRTFEGIPSLYEIELERLAEGYCHLKKLPEALLQFLTLPRLPPEPPLNRDILAHFLPDVVLDFTETGEFRYIISIFIEFEGISAVWELNNWAFILIENIKRFEGYFNHLDFGDKGNMVVCGFGAPVAQENLITRALSFILAVKDNIKDFETLSKLKFKAGITYGIAYAGIAGGKKRCEYTFYGEIVNLAARFMKQADWGEIFVSEAIRNKAPQFNFSFKGEFTYKGITQPVATYTLMNRKLGSRQITFTGPMIGRQAELNQLQTWAASIFTGQFAGITYIFGEAGVGKSRLAYAFLEELSEQHDLTWCTCPTDPILRKSFNPFTSFFMRYFEQSPDNSEEQNKQQFESWYQALIEALDVHASSLADDGVDSSHQAPEKTKIKAELIRTKTIIAAQISLFWKDSLWAQLDAKGKHENTLDAIKNFFLAQSVLKPVVIEIEDGHWLDSDSLAVLEVLTRNVSNYPICLLATLRYNDDGTKTIFQLQGVREQQIDLNYLTEEDIKCFVETELKAEISAELNTLLLEKTNGNPFFVQQLLHYFVEKQIIVLQEHTWQLTSNPPSLPYSLHELLAARIDRLPKEVREIVKAAAVIGQEFHITLLSSILQQDGLLQVQKDILSQIQLIREARIWEEDAVQEFQYHFKHALLCDAAYERQSKSRRIELHQRTAETMEKLYAPHLEKRYADLAFHYEQAEMRDKAIEYLQKAGDYAKAHYQNQQALALYDRLLTQLHKVVSLTEVEIDTLLKKAGILELIGEWQTCQQVCEEALHLAEQIGDRCRMGRAYRSLGIIFRTKDYEKAMTYFMQALKEFEASDDKAETGYLFTSIGLTSDLKGNSDAAMEWYKKALIISEEIGEPLLSAVNASNIGILCDIKEDYKTAMLWYDKSLQISEELGEKLNKSRVLNNIGENHRLQGDYAVAITYFEKALQIKEELGDTFQIALVAGNIGHVLKEQGNYEAAIVRYDRAITILRELRDKYYVYEFLIGKAESLFSLHRFDEAQGSNDEGLQIAEEAKSKEYIRRGNELSKKLSMIKSKFEKNGKNSVQPGKEG